MPLTSPPRLPSLLGAILVFGPLAFASFPARAQQAAPVPAVDTADRLAVIGLYHAYYLSSVNVDAGWSGNLNAGVAGTLSDAFRQGAVRRINYFRAMNGVRGNITLDAAGNELCQQAALMMAAQQNISHAPPADWKFYSAGAATACANSDIRLDWQGDEGALAVDRYVADDEDNNASVGHRRWLLYAAQEKMAVGAVPGDGWTYPGTNATWVTSYGTRPADAPAATSWPPAGFVPAPLVYRRWSYSQVDADFTGAVVSVSRNGVGLAVTQEAPEYQFFTATGGSMEGDNTLVWELPGNTVDPTADETYEVTISNVRVGGVAQTCRYTVTSINPKTVAVALTANKPLAHQGGKKGSFKVTRSGNLTLPLTVAYTVGGSAKASSAYLPLSGTVTIPANSAVARIKVIAVPGALKAADKTVTLTLQGSAGYAVAPPGVATVTILAAP